jgi:hypothetical protein
MKTLSYPYQHHSLPNNEFFKENNEKAANERERILNMISIKER